MYTAAFQSWSQNGCEGILERDMASASWGSGVTTFGTTTLKDKQVRFGIKDGDRIGNVFITGRADSARGDLLLTMALQDIARGLNVVVLDADGNLSKSILERIPSDQHENIIFIDPSDAEYPYSWNILDDIRVYGPEEQRAHYLRVLQRLYAIEDTDFVDEVIDMIIDKKDTTPYTFYALLMDEKFRKAYFNDEEKQKTFEVKMQSNAQLTTILEEQGKYVAKDTMVRNLIAQSESKFTLRREDSQKIIIVDVSRIRVYPTRIAPIISVLLEGITLAAHGDTPLSVYLHDCIRFIENEEMLTILEHKQLAVTVGDAFVQAEDAEKRQNAIEKSATVIALRAHPNDQEMVKDIFAPHATAPELEELEQNEMIVSLTIDGAKQKPFFAHILPVVPTVHSSLQDLYVYAREHYTVARSSVDASLKPKKPNEDDEDDIFSGENFQNAFNQIFGGKQDEAAQAAPQKNGEAPDAKKQEGNDTKAKPAPEPVKEKKGPTEIAEDALKKMVYVPAV